MAKLKHLELPNGNNYDIYGVNVQEISYDDYEALTPTQKNSDIAYCITDTPYEVDDSIYGEASGAIAYFDNGSANPLKSLEVDINPIQDLHGYDAPWAGGAGKNKFDKETLSQPSSYTTLYNSYYYTDPIILKPNTTYTMNPTSTASLEINAYYVLFFTASEDDPFDMTITNDRLRYFVNAGLPKNVSFTTGATGAIRLAVRAIGTGVDTETLAKFMSIDYQLEEGSTATAWTPYSNVCPISGRSSVEVTVAGVNMWDEEYQRGTWQVGGGFTPNDNRIASKNMVSVQPNTQYYIYVKDYSSWTTIIYYDKYKNYLTYATPSANSAFTTPNDAYYLNFNTSDLWGASRAYNNDISINLPSTDTSYHEHVGQTYTIDLGEIRYGGKLNVTTGELTVDRALVDLGTVNWTYSTADTRFFTTNLTDIKKVTDTSIVMNGLCSNYEVVAYRFVNRTSSLDNVIGLYSTSTTNYLAIKDTRYTDTTTFTQAVDGVQLVYELETPTTVTLTPTQVDSLLGNNNIWANSGNVVVVYITSDFIYNELRMNDTVIASNSFAYHSIESESATMAGHANTASNAQTVNGHTVNSDVPSNATFTDTTYTFANGTNGFTVTPSGGTAQTVTVTPSISNNVTGSGTSGYLAKFNGANTITNGAQLGSDTTKFLRNDGTWAVPPGAGVTGNNAGYHNSIYRGKSLGTSITTAQWNAISAGTFDDMYIGDYWTLSTTIGSTTSNIQYVIAGFDYWWNCGDSYPQSSNKHHVVLVPATNLYSAQMNATDITTGGYIGSAMYTTNLANARTGISTLFGNHLYSVRRLFTNSVNTVGQATGWAWATSSVDLMSETMVYGHPVWTTSGFEVGVDRTILPLFALNSASASIYSNWWLRSVATPSYFALVSTYGNATYYNASTTHGVRPAFAIC